MSPFNKVIYRPANSLNRDMSPRGIRQIRTHRRSTRRADQHIHKLYPRPMENNYRAHHLRIVVTNKPHRVSLPASRTVKPRSLVGDQIRAPSPEWHIRTAPCFVHGLWQVQSFNPQPREAPAGTTHKHNRIFWAEQTKAVFGWPSLQT